MKEKLHFNIKNIYIFISIILFSVCICFIDMVLMPGYWVKSGIKVVAFLLLGGIYIIIDRKELSQLKKMFIPKKKDIPIIIVTGAALYIFLVGGYFLLRGIFDFSGIVGKLTSDTGVSRENFIFVALYISLANSLLEELLFRGLGFLVLKRSTSRTVAYLFSSAIFALYHGGMTSGYFNIGIFLLTLLGLFVGGMIFSFIDEKSETVYPSYFVHMCANLGINTVGIILFNQ